MSFRPLAALTILVSIGCTNDPHEAVDRLLAAPIGSCRALENAVVLGDGALAALSDETGDFADLQADELDRATDLVTCIDSDRSIALRGSLVNRGELPARLVGIVALSRSGERISAADRSWVERLATRNINPAEEAYVTATFRDVRGRNEGAVTVIQTLAREVLERTNPNGEGNGRATEWRCPCAPTVLERILRSP
jgi:hypothetical protein